MKNYTKKNLQKMMPWEPDMPMALVSISIADQENGSPKHGDMIAINPDDETDMWLVAEKFFKENYVEGGHVSVGKCPRCNESLASNEVGRATIDGEPAHVNCTIDELDESGMDDDFGCNG